MFCYKSRRCACKIHVIFLTDKPINESNHIKRNGWKKSIRAGTERRSDQTFCVLPLGIERKWARLRCRSLAWGGRSFERLIFYTIDHSKRPLSRWAAWFTIFTSPTALDTSVPSTLSIINKSPDSMLKMQWLQLQLFYQKNELTCEFSPHQPWISLEYIPRSFASRILYVTYDLLLDNSDIIIILSLHLYSCSVVPLIFSTW